jgi:hypothetical protein
MSRVFAADIPSERRVFFNHRAIELENVHRVVIPLANKRNAVADSAESIKIQTITRRWSSPIADK